LRVVVLRGQPPSVADDPSGFPLRKKQAVGTTFGLLLLTETGQPIN
jgi:hypothetical protein